MNEGIKAVAEYKGRKKMNEGIEKTIQGAIDSLKSMPTEARRPTDHKHCKWCRRAIAVEYNKNYCGDHCRSMNCLSLIGIMAFCLAATAYFLAVIGL